MRQGAQISRFFNDVFGGSGSVLREVMHSRCASLLSEVSTAIFATRSLYRFPPTFFSSKNSYGNCGVFSKEQPTVFALSLKIIPIRRKSVAWVPRPIAVYSQRPTGMQPRWLLITLRRSDARAVEISVMSVIGFNRE